VTPEVMIGFTVKRCSVIEMLVTWRGSLLRTSPGRGGGALLDSLIRNIVALP
jgi:hypothetical protein